MGRPDSGGSFDCQAASACQGSNTWGGGERTALDPAGQYHDGAALSPSPSAPDLIEHDQIHDQHGQPMNEAHEKIPLRLMESTMEAGECSDVSTMRPFTSCQPAPRRTKHP